MLKIGDFSKLAQVTVKALRLYDELGLLKPAWIDRFSGYRYYELEQLPRLNRILALKELGFSLDQVAALINDNVSGEQIRGMLRMKQAELQHRLQSEQQRLQQVEARLRQIEREGSDPAEAVVLKRVEPQPMASRRMQVESGARLLPLRAEVSAWLAGQRLPPGGPWVVIYHNPVYAERRLDVELGRLLTAECAGLVGARAGGEVQLRLLEGCEHMAATVQTGADALLAASAQLYRWAQSGGYRVQGAMRELCLQDAGEDTACPVTEVQLPLEPITPPIFIQMIDSQPKEFKMQPRIETRPAFLAVGTLYVGDNANQEIKEMWANQFNPRAAEIKHVCNDREAFGICWCEDSLPQGHFKYLAAFEVDREADVPEGMTLLKVPEQTYAVFTHRGGLDGLQATFRYIYEEWLPASGYRRSAGPDIEVYDEDFKDFAPDSVLYLWIPVTK